MSYQVLARKWRPKNFTEVAGQAHVLKSLINALDNDRLHHAYLLTGTRGVGKTTLARILAKCLNCEEGLSSTPCEKCGSCVEINEGRFIDLIEVDAASRTKVEDTRELLDNVQYTPTRGRFKVYLIDEVHMLSNHSFNALLKTLEEPPPHVKFLFATTDPQKLPITILSRCLQFNLKNLSPQLIVDYLQTVLAKESIKFEESALWQVANAAAGSMRDALTLIDQGISYCEGEITNEGIVEMLGVPDQAQVYNILEAMAENDVAKVIGLIGVLAEGAPDFNHTLDSLLAVLHRIAMAQVVPDAIDNSFGDKQQLTDLAAKFCAEDIQLYYQMGLSGREDLRTATDLRAAFEMMVIRMLVFSPNYTMVEKTGSVEPVAVENEKKKKPVAVKATADSEQLSTETIADDEITPQVTEEDHQPSPEPKAGTSDDFLSLNHEKWLTLFPDLPVNGIAANILANCVLLKAEEHGLSFVLSKGQSSVYNPEIVPKLEQILGGFFERKLTVTIEIAESQLETAAQLSQRLKLERHSDMVNEFESDANVQELLKHFSGTVAKDSIAPVSEGRRKI